MRFAAGALITTLLVGGLTTANDVKPAHAAVSPTPIPANASWLTTVNYYRSIAGLPGVTENTSWSSGAANHSKYVAYNGVVHDEVSGNPYYSASGDQAGNNGNVAAHSYHAVTPRQFVEMWMTGPYHAIGILRPRLKSSGYGHFSTTSTSFKWKSAGTLDVWRGHDWSQPASTTAVLFPGSGKTSPLTTYSGGESPNPMTPCGSGWAAPTSAPVIAMLPNATSNVTATLSGPSGLIPASDLCVISRANTTGVANQILSGDNAVVIFARKPFANGIYQATIKSGTKTTAWSFTIDSRVLDGTIPPPPSLPDTALVGAPSKLTPMTPPSRVVDTRTSQGGSGPIAAGTVKTFRIKGIKGVSAGATAAAANVTAVAPALSGYVTVYPCAATRPSVSTVNFTQGVTTANAALLPLSSTGDVCVFASANVDVIIDVSGSFSATATDLFNAVTPSRIHGSSAGDAALTPTSVVTVPVAGVGAVPQTASAVAVSVSALNPSANGHVTVAPCGVAGSTSTINVRAGVSRSNLAIIDLPASGDLCVSGPITADITVDVVGYFSATGSQVQALQPIRLVDTRSTDTRIAVLGSGIRLGTNTSTRIQVKGLRKIPTGTAVSVNVTAVQPVATGRLLVYPCGAPPLAATVHYQANAVVAGAALTKLDASGGFCIHTTAATHVIVDVNAIFVG